MFVCQNQEGYTNLNTIQFEGEKIKYYNQFGHLSY